VFAEAAVGFIRSAPADRPFLLYFAPTAPHAPRLPAREYRGSWTEPIERPASFDEPDVGDKPAWVRSIGRFDPETRQRLDDERTRQYETLRSVDDAVAAIVAALRARGELGNTVVFFLTDNGYAFGEHRWRAKSCPYEVCVGTPLLVRYPGATSRTVTTPVSAVDLAPTIAALAGVRPGPVDGLNLVPTLEGRPGPARAGLLIQFPGDARIPGWWQVRTERYAYVEYDTGETELYDAVRDPDQLTNVAGTAAGAGVAAELSALLHELRTAPPRAR
jgi:arylsulfatase A-like enzyme